MKTLIYSTSDFERPFIENAAHGNHELVYTEQSLNENTVKLAKGFDAISLFSTDEATLSLLEKLYTCGVRYIALRTVEHDYINLIKAHALGIKVANTPNATVHAVAEHAVGLLLAVNRKLALAQKLIQIGDHRLEHLVGFDLHGKTIGIIGTGKIGSHFAKIMHGFGCKILACDPIENKELETLTNFSYTTFYELCVNSDVISVHCALNSTTNHLCNQTAFALMRKAPIFINTAHGSIVNTKDLIEAIDLRMLAGVGLDVYEHEKTIFFRNHIDTPINDELYHKLLSRPNVLIAGHQGFLTTEALQGIANTTIANLNSWAYNGISVNEIK